MQFKSLALFSMAMVCTLVLFQNCSASKFTDQSTMQDTAGAPAIEIKYCEYNGKSDYRPGAIIKTFVSSSVAYNQECVEQSHTCVDGKFSGTLGFTTCARGVPQDCMIGTDVVAHGTSVERWEAASVPHTGTCRSQQRECTNGQISGSYTVKTACQKLPPPAPTGKLECQSRPGADQIVQDLYEKWSDGSLKLKESCSLATSQRANRGFNCGKITDGPYPNVGDIDSQPSCCPSGRVTVNGLCMPIVGVGGTCFANANCQDGLECGTDYANPSNPYGVCKTR